MLHSVQTLIGYSVKTRDADAGQVRDLLFTGQDWAAKYVVVELLGDRAGQEVLVPIRLINDLNWETRELYLRASLARLHRKPNRQRPTASHHYYHWPYFWTGGGVLGTAALAGAETPDESPPRVDPTTTGLHSFEDLQGIKIQAVDGRIGVFSDILLDPQDWKARYAVIAPRSWWPTRQTLIDIGFIHELSADNRNLYVDLTREQIRSAPAYDPTAPLRSTEEERLHHYFVSIRRGSRFPRAG